MMRCEIPSTPEEKRKVLTRARRIRGQIGALEQSSEDDTECRAILQQIVAVRGTTSELMAKVLKSHIREMFNRNGCYSYEVS